MGAQGTSAVRGERMPRYQRILLKLSGEVMAGEGSFGLDAGRMKALAEEVAEVAKAGVQIGLVVGGGNFFRGVAAAAGAVTCITKPFDFDRLRECDAIFICVPTPLSKNREPDISYILDTGKNIARHLQKGMLVVLESTTYPGTTDEDLREVLEIGSGLEAGKDFHLAFSPIFGGPVLQ